MLSFFIFEKGSMIELGVSQVLEVKREVSIGVYLGDDEMDILLPNNQLVDQEIKTGDKIEVFVYKDSEDRFIATRKTPYIQKNELAVLEVLETTNIGAFLDWGLEKDLFLPFKEQTIKVEIGKKYLVAMYVDKSERLCATMNIGAYLSEYSEYNKDDEVRGTIYDIKREIGVFVAVDNEVFGLIPRNEYFEKYKIGEEVLCRVVRVREDGKLDLSPRKKAYQQMDEDAEMILEFIKNSGGEIEYGDHSSPEQIKKKFQISKKAFKRAVGRLLKNNLVEKSAKGLKLSE